MLELNSTVKPKRKIRLQRPPPSLFEVTWPGNQKSKPKKQRTPPAWMQLRRRRTPLQLPSQKQKPLRPSRRKGERLPGKNPLPAPRPPIPEKLPPPRKSPSLQTTTFVSAPTSSPSIACGSRCPATPTTIGSKPAASSSKKRSASILGRARLRRAAECLFRVAARQSLALPEPYASPIVSIPGKHSFTFSISRLIANGFGTNPRTPGSRNNSCARFSSPFPVTSSSGGTIRGGTE